LRRTGKYVVTRPERTSKYRLRNMGRASHVCPNSPAGVLKKRFLRVESVRGVGH